MNCVPPGSRLRFAPFHIMTAAAAAAVALGVAVVVAVTLLAHQRPWLGIGLEPATDGAGAVVVSAIGPSAKIPKGTVLTSAASAADELELTAFDLTTEPDGAMGDYATYRRFLDRQTRLARIQDSAEVVFTANDGARFVVVPDAGGRPLRDFPPDFWVRCFVGLAAWLAAAAVFAFRPREPASRYLLLSGLATLIFAPAAAVYTTRELAVDGTLLGRASDLNFFGGSLFAASFVALLLVYPRRIAPRWVGPAVVALFVVLDLTFLYGLHFSLSTSLALALLICGVVWLPLRGWLWHRFAGRRDSQMKDLFGQVMDVALAAPGDGERALRWRELMAGVFEPLQIADCDAVDVAIREDGLVMEVPRVGEIGGLRLGYAGLKLVWNSTT